MSAQEFVEAARSFKGVKWRHRGRTPRALDCVGLVVLSAKKCGLDTRDTIRYGREPWDNLLRSALIDRFGHARPPSQARPGDIALIQWAREPSHLAIVGNHPNGGLSLIQAHNLHGVIEYGLVAPYTRCVVEVYRPWPEAN